MHDENQHDDAAVERHLNAQRAELTPVELDTVKRGVLAKATRQGGRGMFLRSRLAVLLIAGLVASGGGAVLAASGGSSSNGSSSNSQYCPPNSPGHGKPKHHGGGNKCGQPCDNSGKGNNKNKDKCKCDKPKKHKHKCP